MPSELSANVLTGIALNEVELGPVKFGSLLHQELHGLAFCSETVRQIDFTNCFPENSVRREMSASGKWPAFLFPILNLLELGLTKCNRLLLSGNYLRSADVEALSKCPRIRIAYGISLTR